MSRALAAGLVLTTGMIAGGLMLQSSAAHEASASPATSRVFDQVVDHVRRDFVDTLQDDDIYRRTAAGFVKELGDDYSALLSPERLRRVRENTSGRYPGIGIEIDFRDGFVTVIAPVRGTPADSAGILPGDRILTVDGKSTSGLSMEEVQDALRGPSGTSVALGLERNGETRVVKLRRREILFHPVRRAENLLDGIGYVALGSFSQQAAGELSRAVDSLVKHGARSLVLDLRENPGGLLEQGIEVADLFLDAKSTIASTRGRTPDANHEFDDEAPQRWPELPVVVLVDSGTASAAEIVAGALQDNRRALLVGSPTYGKGSAQSVFPVLGGNGLKLTTARWYTPSGRTIERDTANKGGIIPDVVIRPDSARSAPDLVLKTAIDRLRSVRTASELTKP